MNLRCNMMHISAFYSYWQKFIQILMVKSCLRLINQSQHFAIIVVKLQIMMVYGLTGLYIQRIRVMFRQYVEGHNSFKYEGGTRKFHLGKQNGTVVIYQEGEQSHYGYYCTSDVKIDNTWFLISDSRILRQHKLQCNTKDINVPQMLSYKKISNFLEAAPIY